MGGNHADGTTTVVSLARTDRRHRSGNRNDSRSRGVRLVARRPLAQPAVFPYGRPALCNGRLEPAARTAGRARQVRATGGYTWLRAADGAGRKKSAAMGRADKGLEIFFVNEKVCFEKQPLQYSRSAAGSLTLRHTIICYVGSNNHDCPGLALFFTVNWCSDRTTPFG